MKDTQHDQHRGMKRDADEDRKKSISGSEGPQRSLGMRSGSEGIDRPERDGQSRMDLAQLIETLREQFEQDRAVASQTGSARCGICYLYYRQTDLVYREEEGFYICKSCQRSLGNGKIKMVRRQQR